MISHVFSKENKALLSELVRTDFKLRYQGSVLGYAWSLLRPLLLFIILYIVFVNFLKIGSDIPNYSIYLLLGIVLWNFFADMTSQSLGSIVARGDLIRKIRIPRWMIVFSSSISAIINLGFNLIVVAIFMVFNGVEINHYALLFPFLLIELYVLGLGVSLFLSASFVKYRDVSYIWEVVLQAGFYATPILYPLSIIQSEFQQKILLANPIAQVIQDARNLLVTDKSITIVDLYGTNYAFLISLVLTIIFFIVGLFYFKKNATSFAENL